MKIEDFLESMNYVDPEVLQNESMSKWRTGIFSGIRRGLIIVPVVLVLSVVLIMVFKKPSVTALADEYSFEKYRQAELSDDSEQFRINYEESMHMMDSFFGCLPYKGKYPSGPNRGDYTIGPREADDFPDYYAGAYENKDGNLIIMIKSGYYSEDYRSSDWYKELIKMTRSENFRCRPVKYNYTELINGLSEITELSVDETKPALSIEGIELSYYGLNEYINQIVVGVRNEEDQRRMKQVLTSDLYVVLIGDHIASDELADAVFELNDQVENLPEEFWLNQSDAEKMMSNFYRYLNGKYGFCMDEDVYTVNGIRAENFPEYYAGCYINIEGRLVVQITEKYYQKDYRNTNWYKEFSDIVKGENFLCHPAKYSYGELVNAIYEVSIGNVAKELGKQGISIVDSGVNDYYNWVKVGVRSEEDYKVISDMINSDIYQIRVVDYTPSDT